MIRVIKHKGLKKLYAKGDGSGLRTDIAKKAALYLSILDTAEQLSELDVAGFGFHPLAGLRDPAVRDMFTRLLVTQRFDTTLLAEYYGFGQPAHTFTVGGQQVTPEQFARSIVDFLSRRVDADPTQITQAFWDAFPNLTQLYLGNNKITRLSNSIGKLKDLELHYTFLRILT